MCTCCRILGLSAALDIFYHALRAFTYSRHAHLFPWQLCLRYLRGMEVESLDFVVKFFCSFLDLGTWSIVLQLECKHGNAIITEYKHGNAIITECNNHVTETWECNDHGMETWELTFLTVCTRSGTDSISDVVHLSSRRSLIRSMAVCTSCKVQFFCLMMTNE